MFRCEIRLFFMCFTVLLLQIGHLGCRGLTCHDSMIEVSCLSLAGEELLRFEATTADSALETQPLGGVWAPKRARNWLERGSKVRKCIARALRVDLPCLRLVLPDGSLWSDLGPKATLRSALEKGRFKGV